MPRNPLALLAASGWSHAFDGTLLPEGSVPFTSEHLAGSAGSVLVLGSGSGLWPEALARAGLRVTVMDGSRVLLGEMRERFAATPDLAAVEFVHGDFRDFEPVEGVGSVLLPAPGPASFGTREERRAIYACVAAQVSPGGSFLLHTEPLPGDLASPGGSGAATFESEFADPEGGAPLLRRTTVGRDGSGRPLVRHAFRSRAGGGIASECGLLLCPVDPGETAEDLESSGLAVRGMHAGFTPAPHAPGGPLVVLAARSA